MTAPIPDANDVLMGTGGAPAAKFTAPGDTIGGRIVAPPRAYQEREYDPRNPGNGALKFYQSGDPIMGIHIDVQTNLRDPSISDDTGVRRIYVQGKRLKDAVRNAVQQAGAAKIETGGELHVTHTGLGQPSGPGVNPPKEYTATYSPPQAAVNDALGLGQQQQPAAAPQQAAQPAQQAPAPAAQPPAAAPAGVDPGALQAALANLGPDALAALQAQANQQG